MNCPRCGAPTNRGVAFCPNCGAALTSYQQPPAPYAGSVQPPKKSNATLIAIVAIVVVIIVGIAAIPLLYNSSTAGNNSSNNSTSFSTEKPVGIAVSAVRGYASSNSFSQPDDGNILITIAFNITNNVGSEISLNPNYFTLTCSDGTTHDYSWYVDYSIPDGLADKATAAAVLGFEIPVGVSPKTLTFEDWYRSKSVEVSSSVIDLTVPALVHIEVLSVTNSTGEGYYIPDEGNKYVIVQVKFTNKMNVTIERYQLYFSLLTADGTSHDLDYGFRYTLPDGIQAGATVTYTFSFEISESTSPTMLVYDEVANLEFPLNLFFLPPEQREQPLDELHLDVTADPWHGGRTHMYPKTLG